MKDCRNKNNKKENKPTQNLLIKENETDTVNLN